MLQRDYPDDYVLCTGESHSVIEFAKKAFKIIGMNVEWKGSGVNEVGLSQDSSTLVKVSREFFRPLESDNYKADYSKAWNELIWEPKTRFLDLVQIMVENDVRITKVK